MWRCAGNLEEVEQLGALRFRSLLFALYDRWDRLHAPRRASRLHDSTLAVLGPKSQPKLHARAMETLYLFFFVVELLEAHADALPNGRHYLVAGRALRQYLVLLKDLTVNIPASAFQQWVDLCKEHLLALTRADFHFCQNTIFGCI